MAIALVSHVAASTGTTVPFSASITTSGANNIIIAWIVLNGPSGTIRPTAPTISDSNNLTWFLRKNSVPDDFAVPDMYMYYAWAPTGITTSVSVSALNPVSMSLTMAAFSGVNTTAPFDPNLAMPSQTNGTDLIFNTTLPNSTLIAAFSVSSATPIATYGVPSGWTAVSTDGNYCFAAFKSVTSAQSMSTTGFAGATANNSGLGDALQPAAVAGYNYGNLTSSLGAAAIAAAGATTTSNAPAYQWSNYGYPSATAASGTYVGVDNADGPNGYIAAGDCLVAVITLCTQSSAPPAVPTMSGWTLKGINTATPNNGTVMAIFARTGTAGETANYTCLWSGGPAAFATWTLFNYGSCVLDYVSVAALATSFFAPQPVAYTSSINDIPLAIFYNGGSYGLVDAPGGYALPRVDTTLGGQIGYLSAYEGPQDPTANDTIIGPPGVYNPESAVDQVAALLTFETQPPGSSVILHGVLLENTGATTVSASGTITGTGYPSSYAWSKHGDSAGKGSTTMTLTGAGPVAVGDCLVALIGALYGAATTMTVTMPSPWVKATTQDYAGASTNNNGHFQIWYCQATAATSSYSVTANTTTDGYGVYLLFNYTNSTFESAVDSLNATTSANYIQAPAPTSPHYNGDVVLNLWWSWGYGNAALTSSNVPAAPAQRIAFGTSDGTSSLAATEYMVINKTAGFSASSVNAAGSGLVYPYGGTVVITPAAAASGNFPISGAVTASLGAASFTGAGNVYGAGGAQLTQTTAAATLSSSGTVSGSGSHPGGYVWAVYTSYTGWGDDNAASPVATQAYIGGATSYGSNIQVNDTNTPMFPGDLIVIGIMTTTYTTTDSGAISMPGWTQLGSQVSTNGARLAVFYANSGGGGWSGIPTGMYASWTNPAYYSYTMMNYGGASVDTGALLAQTPAQNGNGANTTTPAITTTKANDILLGLFFKYASLVPSVTTGFSAFPSGFTSRVNVNSAQYLPVGAAESSLATAGSVPAYSATSAADGTYSLAAMVAIKPNIVNITGIVSETLSANALSAAGYVSSNLSTGTLAQTTGATTLSASGSVTSPVTGAVTFNAGVSGYASSAPYSLPALTTTVPNTVIVLFAEENGNSLASFDISSPTITDTAGLTWVKRKAQPSSQTPFGIYEYYAIMPSAGTITITYNHTSAGVSYLAIAAGAFAGVNLTTPYDINGSVPQGGTSNNGATGSTPISTSASATAIIYSSRQGVNTPASYAPPTGFTNFDASPNNTPYLQTYYGIFSSPQTNKNTYNPNLAGTTGNGWISDALQAANVAAITGNLTATVGPGTLSSAGNVFATGDITLDTYALNASGTTSGTIAITTSLANELIILWVEANATTGGTPTVSDTAGLTWTLRKNQASSQTPDNICEFYAFKPTAGSTTITVSLATAFYIVMNAVAYIGVNTSIPFDPNNSLPASAASGAVSYSTSNPLTTVITGIRTSDGANPIASGLVPTGFTPTSVDGQWLLSGYTHNSTAQTNKTVTYPGTNNGIIVDALIPVGANPPNTGTLARTLGAATLSAAGNLTGVTTHTATWIFSPKADTLVAAAAGVLTPISGTVNEALNTASFAATGSVSTNTGTLARTLGAATLAALGTVSSTLGTLAQTTAAATLSAAGSVTVNGGTLSQTTGSASLVSSGLVLSVITGAGGEDLGTAILSAAGNLTTPVLYGTLAQTLGAVTTNLAGTVYPVLIGTLAETTGAAILAAAGAGAFATITGTLGQTLGSAYEPYPATGLVSLSGAASQTLGAATLSAAGNLTNAITGNLGNVQDALFANSSSSVLGATNNSYFDQGGVELGLAFVPAINTSVTSIQFYKAASDNILSRKVSLWDPSGLLIGQGSTTSEPIGTAQWIVVNLTTPVPITAGQTYTASYHAGSSTVTTWYEQQLGGITNPTTHGNLSTPANAGRYLGYFGFPSSLSLYPVNATPDWYGLSVNTVGSEIYPATLAAAGNVMVLSIPMKARGLATGTGRNSTRFTIRMAARGTSTKTAKAALMQRVKLAARGRTKLSGKATLAPVASTSVMFTTRSKSTLTGRAFMAAYPPPTVVEAEHTYKPFTTTPKVFSTVITTDATGDTLVIERAPTMAPNEVREVAFDFSSELATGETITSARVNIYYNTTPQAAPAIPANQPGDMTYGAVGIVGNQVTTTLSLGVYGKDYIVTFTAVTSLGEIIPRSILLASGQT